MWIEGNVPYVTNGNGNNGFGFGNGWEGLIGLALVAGLFGNGWGNGGFGFGGGRGIGVTEGFTLATDFATLERKMDGINNGLCDGFYAQNTNMLNGFASVQQSLCQGFSGVNSTIVNNGYETRNAITNGFNTVNQGLCNLGYNLQGSFNSLSHQISDCCCDIKTMNLENRYLNERQTCQIIEAINAGNQRLVDIYTNDKIESLRAENTALKGQISDERLGDRIINKLSPCPSPAFIVPNPNCCYDYTVTRNSGCGCY